MYDNEGDNYLSRTTKGRPDEKDEGTRIDYRLRNRMNRQD
jgi:hypothetical protein